MKNIFQVCRLSNIVKKIKKQRVATPYKIFELESYLRLAFKKYN